MTTSDTALAPSTQPKGWAARWFWGLGSRGGPADAASHAQAKGAESPAKEIQAVTRRLIADDRYAFVLLAEAADDVDEADAQAAWQVLEKQMALVPGGVVPVVRADGTTEPSELAAFYLDRFAVTNQQFARFVKAGCYDALEIWPREIWPGLLRFTDRTGRPGPRTWEQGAYKSGEGNHPVTGVCWYEALAYARWVGKRLATAAEWQKAGGWPEHLSGGNCNRYPWGDLYAEGRANLWASGLGHTAPADGFREGATLNGIHQMSGNVWEWLDDPLETIPCRAEETFRALRPMRRIVGGAYDTYLPGEATNQFITGQPELDRRANLGFRCAVSVDRLRPAPHAGGLPPRSVSR
jgi:formylglycine-generating enzyme required for sulfatase activity